MVICPMSRISDIIRMRTSSAIYKTFTHIEMKEGIDQQLLTATGKVGQTI
jgi:hypothetical protein